MNPLLRLVLLPGIPLALCFAPVAGSAARGSPVAPARLPVNEPVPVTSEPEPVLDAGVSRDGRWLVVSSGRGGFSDLWLRSGDPARVELPRQLTFDPADETAPALSPDGKTVAYVGTGHDAKGDIYLLDLRSAGATPRRLTDRDTEDGAPCFSPDGKTLYFHRRLDPTEPRLQIVSLDTAAPGASPRVVEVGGDGGFPAPSPDGKRLAFVSRRDDGGGDLFLLDLGSGAVSRLTGGPEVDGYPAWSADGRNVYFVRFFLDTDRDGSLTPRDNGAIFRVAADRAGARAYPVTSTDRPALRPLTGGSTLYLLSGRGGIANVWSLPADGEVPTLESAERQFELARVLSARVPADAGLTAVGYARVQEAFPGSESAPRAAYEAGRLYSRLGYGEAGERILQALSQDYPKASPWVALAALERTMIRALRDARAAVSPADKGRIARRAAEELRQTAEASPSAPAGARAGIDRARLVAEFGGDAASLTEAISLLDGVIRDYPSERAAAAEAVVARADVYARLAPAAEVRAAYLAAVDAYPDVEEWADQAVERVLEQSTASISGGPEAAEAKVRLLRDVARENAGSRPRLAMGALNRVGDLYYASDEWAAAKAAYRQVLQEFPVVATRTAAARMALAEILYREERFREALSLYETEIALRPVEDPIYRLARAGYIRKSADSGEFLYRTGEVSAARKVFRELLDYDDSVVEAHRGYIKCAAAQGELEPVLAGYRERLRKEPTNPVVLYATGLCLTYRETKRDTVEARTLIERAVSLRGQVEYFHQTLGYVDEVLETAYGEKGSLAAAAESYQKAYFLNDHRANPGNAANLLLNLGNAHHLLGQHRKAFELYSQRLDSKVPFEGDEVELLFLRRLGMSAFQVREPQATIDAFTKALGLVQAGREPKRASEAFDRLSRQVLERIVPLAEKIPGAAAEARAAARAQSDINRRLALLSKEEVEPPPAASWDRYRKGVETLLGEQEGLNRRAASLGGSVGVVDAGPTLAGLAAKVSQALQYPERLSRLEAELFDRLGLACQEAGRWDEAAEAFEKAFARNEKLGLVANLARNRRSAAFSTYERAGLLAEGSEERRSTLRRAQEGFRQALELLAKHGVPGRQPAKGGALLELQFEVAADKAGATAAAYGFSAEQEKRLCEAFLARIAVELGELPAAGEALRSQLDRYPPGKPIAPADVYGVSLLFHRAGQLAAAQGRWVEAFGRFRRSAALSAQTGGAVAAGLGVANMAHAVSALGRADGEAGRLRAELAEADREAGAALKRDPAALLSAFGPWYHNTLGVHWARLAGEDQEASPRDAALQMVDRVRAGQHLALGLKALSDQGEAAARDRGRVALLAALHLNLAELALQVGDMGAATEHREAALEAARRGLLPELEWRALAGLGRLEEALTALRSVPILRAGCGPHEVEAALGASVAQLLSANGVEEAFNRAELLGELERVHRLAPLTLGRLSPEERNISREAAPRLLRVRELRKKVGRAQGEERGYLQSSLDKELELLQRTLGRERERLPALARLASGEDRQNLVTALLGLAVRAEDAANTAVESSGTGVSADAKAQHAAITAQYGELLGEALSEVSEGEPPGVLALFGPAPAQAVEAMEAVSEGGALLRLYRTGGGGAPYAAFTVTGDGLLGSLAESPGAVSLPREGPLYLAYEEPTALPLAPGATLALSATHLVRSHQARKPFKRTLLADRLAGGEPSGFERRELVPQAGERELLEALTGVHTLLLGGRLSLIASVPTRAGDRPRRLPAVELSSGAKVPLVSVARRAAQASLAALPGATRDAAYPSLQLLSLFGTASVLLPLGPGSAPPEALAAQFLGAYGQSPAYQALASVEQRGERTLALFGFRGMGAEEAAAFARARFLQIVAKAREALQTPGAEGGSRALPYLQEAILTAREAKELSRYLPDLYRFARESAFRAGRTEEAAEYARELVELAGRVSPDSEAHAEALLRLALLEARLERYDRAVPRLQEARDMLANLDLPAQETEVLSGLGATLENATDYEGALTEYQTAATLSGQLGKREVLARQHGNIGRLYDLRLSQYARARQSYESALEIYRELGDKAGTAQALLDIGRCFRLLGNFAEAASHYEQALALVEGEGGATDALRRLKAKVLIEQANNAWFQGQYQDAFNLQRASLDLARQGGWLLDEVIARNTSGLLWWTLGDRDKALRELGDALRLAEKVEGRRDEVATTLNNIGLVYREMGRYEEALKTLDRALEIDRKIKSRWAIAYDLRNRGLTLLRMGRVEDALSPLEEACAEAGAIGDRVNEAKARQALAEAEQALGRPERAAAAYRQALDLARSMALRETEWRALYGLAQLGLAAGATADARKYLEEAAEVIEGMRAGIKIDQLKDGFLIDKLGVYETLVRLLADSGDAVGAFEVAERSRSRGFIDLLGNQRLSLAGAVDQQFYNRQKTLRSRMEEAEALLAQASTDEEKRVYGETLGRLRDEHRDLLLEIQAKNPQLAALVAVEPLKAESVQALLEEGVALAAYYLVPGEVFCWAIRRGSIQLFRTAAGASPLGEQLLEYRRRLQNLEPQEELSAQLFRLLVGPVLPALAGVRQLGIIPHGALHYLSFATLSDGSDYLIDRFPLFYLPSASVLRYTLQRRTEGRSPKVLAIGNPDLGDPFLDLPFAEQEVGAIRWNFPEITVLTRERATESWVRTHIGEFGIIHLASHGEFDPINPLFSAVKLVPDREQDGNLEAGEVFGLDIRADLVVLSACQTGLGKVSAGDDVVGLNRAFLYAGTHAIVSSLWRVSDVSTAVLAKQFYREYRAGAKAEALRRATLHVKNRYPHPGYWGAFSLTGDYL